MTDFWDIWHRQPFLHFSCSKCSISNISIAFCWLCSFRQETLSMFMVLSLCRTAGNPLAVMCHRPPSFLAGFSSSSIGTPAGFRFLAPTHATEDEPINWVSKSSGHVFGFNGIQQQQNIYNSYYITCSIEHRWNILKHMSHVIDDVPTARLCNRPLRCW